MLVHICDYIRGGAEKLPAVPFKERKMLKEPAKKVCSFYKAIQLVHKTLDDFMNLGFE